MRVSISVAWFAMGGPPGMPYTNVAMKRLIGYTFFESSHFSLLFSYHKFIVADQRNAGAVVSPVFESLKPF